MPRCAFHGGAVVSRCGEWTVDLGMPPHQFINVLGQGYDKRIVSVNCGSGGHGSVRASTVNPLQQ